MLRHREDALDVVQETFTRAYESLDRFKGDATFYTWVYRIAYNLCLDHQRRDAKRRSLPLEVDDRGEDAALPLPDGPLRGLPFERTRDAEIADRLGGARRALTAGRRAVTPLRDR